jgi:hypothetical protein
LHLTARDLAGKRHDPRGAGPLLFQRPRTSAGTVRVAFHPSDPHLFAVTMDPAPHRATLYRIQRDAQ